MDDEPDVRDLLRTLLEIEGYSVECAANGVEALVLLERDPRAAVVILDLTMPAMDGFAFRGAMLRDPRLATIPVVVVSALRPSGAPADLLKPAAVVPKPVDPEALLARLDTLCRSRPPAGGRAVPD